LINEALRLHAAHRFRTVWVEYVFLSKVLDGFSPSVLKVIDAHDVFSERFAMMRAGELEPEWFYTDPEAERKGLARADRVVAIQDRDAAAFIAMGLARVTTIGHFPAVRPAPGKPAPGRILYVASDNSGNVKAWDHFVRTMLTPIGERLPDASIQVAGKICRRIPESPRCVKLGPVEDLGSRYGSAVLAVNPEILGTGLKIKTIEALAHGCPVVTTPAGIRGLEEAEGCGILLARTPEEFADGVAKLMTRSAFRDEQSRSALAFADRYLRRNREALSRLLAGTAPSGPGEESP